MNPLLDALAGPTGLKLALALLHFVWQGVLIAAVAAGLMQLVGRRSSQRRYVIGVAGMVLMAAAPIVTFCLVTPPEPPPIEPVPLVDAADLLVDLEQVDAFLATLDMPVREVPMIAPQAVRLTWPERLRLIQPYAVLLWLAGSLLCGLRLVIGAYSSLRCRRGRRAVPEPWLDAVVKAAGCIGIKSPNVFVSDRVAEAIAVGLLRPMVLLPAAWIGRIPPDVLEAVLAHELAHIRRHDLWVNLFQRIVESLLFYHPAVWWLSRRVRLEREYCCDETAAAAVAGRAAYARALEYVATERVAEGRTELFQAALAAGMRGEDSMALLNRVHRVLGNDTRPRRTPRLSEGLLALAVPAALWAAVVTIGPAFAQEDPVEAPHAEPMLDDVVEDIHRDFNVQPGKSLDDMVEGLAQNDGFGSSEDGFTESPSGELHETLRELRKELKALRNEVEVLRTNQHVKDIGSKIPVYRDPSDVAKGERLPPEVTGKDGRRYQAVTEIFETVDGKKIPIKRYVPAGEIKDEWKPNYIDPDNLRPDDELKMKYKAAGLVRDAALRELVEAKKQKQNSDVLEHLQKNADNAQHWLEELQKQIEVPASPGAADGTSIRTGAARPHGTGDTPVAPDRLTTVIRGDRIVTYRIGSDFDLLEVEIQQSGLPKSEEDVQSILEILTSLFGENRPVWAVSSRWKKLDDDRVELEITLWNGSTPTFLLSEHNGRLRIKPIGRFFLSDGSAPFFGHDTPSKKPNPYGATGSSSIRQRSQVTETQDAAGIARQYRSGRNAMRVATALAKPVSLQFEKTPLTHVLVTLRNIADVDFVVDKAGLDEEGVTTETPVSIDVNDMPIRDVLSTILTPLHLAAATDDGVVKITSRQRAKGPLHVKAYPVADLVLPMPHGNVVTKENGELAIGFSPEKKQRINARVDNLIDLITANVEPGSWVVVGGQGVIRKNDTTLSLVIRQTNHVHIEIHSLLEQLRQMRRIDSDAVLEPDNINRTHFTPAETEPAESLDVKTDKATAQSSPRVKHLIANSGVAELATMQVTDEGKEVVGDEVHRYVFVRGVWDGGDMQFQDFELQRQMRLSGKSSEQWEKVDLNRVRDVLARAKEFSDDVVSPQTMNSVFTAPLPGRVDGEWENVSHPRIDEKQDGSLLLFRCPDFNVKPDVEYRYRVRLKIVGDDGIRSTEWSEPTEWVKVPAPMIFAS